MDPWARLPAALGRGAAGLLLVTLAACGDSAKNTTPAATPAEHTHQDEQTVNTSATEAIPTVVITAHEFAFEAPDSIPAGLTRLHLNNTGHEDHHALLMRLNNGVSLDQFLANLQKDDIGEALSLITLVGGPGAVVGGASSDVVENLQPGSYVILCVLAGEDQVPHFVKGMVKPLDVTGTAPAEVTYPPSVATITLRDFAFEAPATLPAGTTTVQVTNAGPQPHEAMVVRLEGVTLDQLKAMIAASEGGPDPSQSGPPPFTSVGGIGPLEQGATGQMTLDLTPGDYALVCFVPDPGTGHAHAELGMVGGFTVQ
jgi:uncharacterized cupredoxin-like copper-binding protein